MRPAQFEAAVRAAIARIQIDVLRLHKPVVGILPPLYAARQTLDGQRFLEKMWQRNAHFAAINAKLAAVLGQ